jgi:hypothetical protein
VDLCNAASVAHSRGRLRPGPHQRLPAGAPATGSEVYETFSGEIEYPEPGEIIFADTAGRAHARAGATAKAATRQCANPPSTR